jgi:hypothetical protein
MCTWSLPGSYLINTWVCGPFLYFWSQHGPYGLLMTFLYGTYMASTWLAWSLHGQHGPYMVSMVHTWSAWSIHDQHGPYMVSMVHTWSAWSIYSQHGPCMVRMVHLWSAWSLQISYQVLVWSIPGSNGKSSIVEERILRIVFVPLIVEEQVLRFVFVP